VSVGGTGGPGGSGGEGGGSPASKPAVFFHGAAGGTGGNGGQGGTGGHVQVHCTRIDATAPVIAQAPGGAGGAAGAGGKRGAFHPIANEYPKYLVNAFPRHDAPPGRKGGAGMLGTVAVVEGEGQ
jgi:hypothetical protein